MTTVIRLADARFSASTMISCSMIWSLIGAEWLCSTNASQPRTDSSNRTKISPLANEYADCGVIVTSSCFATCSASSGWARPEKSMRLFFVMAVLELTAGSTSRWRPCAASAAGVSGRFFSTQPSMMRWGPPETASAPGGTSCFSTAPAPV